MLPNIPSFLTSLLLFSLPSLTFAQSQTFTAATCTVATTNNAQFTNTSITYNNDAKALTYSANVNVLQPLTITKNTAVEIRILLLGASIYNQTVDVCSIQGLPVPNGVSCAQLPDGFTLPPGTYGLPPGKVQLPQEVPSFLPSLLNVPGVGFTAQLLIMDGQTPQACAQVDSGSKLSTATLGKLVSGIMGAVVGVAGIASVVSNNCGGMFWIGVSMLQNAFFTGFMSGPIANFYLDYSASFSWSTGIVPKLYKFAQFDGINLLNSTANKLARRQFSSSNVTSTVLNALTKPVPVNPTDQTGVYRQLSKLGIVPDDFLIVLIAAFALVMAFSLAVLALGHFLIAVVPKSKFQSARRHYSSYYIAAALFALNFVFMYFAIASVYTLTITTSSGRKILGVVCLIISAAIPIVCAVYLRNVPHHDIATEGSKVRKGFSPWIEDYRPQRYLFFLIVFGCKFIDGVAAGATYLWVNPNKNYIPACLSLAGELILLIAIIVVRPFPRGSALTGLSIYSGLVQCIEYGVLIYVANGANGVLAQAIAGWVLMGAQLLKYLGFVLVLLFKLCGMCRGEDKDKPVYDSVNVRTVHVEEGKPSLEEHRHSALGDAHRSSNTPVMGDPYRPSNVPVVGRFSNTPPPASEHRFSGMSEYMYSGHTAAVAPHEYRYSGMSAQQGYK